MLNSYVLRVDTSKPFGYLLCLASHLRHITIKRSYYWNPNRFEPSCPLSANETTLNSLIFSSGWFTAPTHCLPFHSVLISPPLPSQHPLHSSALFPPHPIIKTILPRRSRPLPPPGDEKPAFHGKVISLPWIRSINSIYLACSFHRGITKWKGFKGGVHLVFLTKRKGVCPAAGTRFFFQVMAQFLSGFCIIL